MLRVSGALREAEAEPETETEALLFRDCVGVGSLVLVGSRDAVGPGVRVSVSGEPLRLSEPDGERLSVWRTEQDTVAVVRTEDAIGARSTNGGAFSR